MSVNLASRFDEIELYEISWYCRFREAHSGLDSLAIWNRIESLNTTFDTATGPLCIPAEYRDSCYSKWPNQADYVYLRTLRPAAQS